MGARNRFQLSFTATTGRQFLPFIRRNLIAAQRLIRIAPNEVSVALVGDKRMSLLHQQFMGIPGPTDVLTFPLEQESNGRVTSGSIAVCVPEAARAAGRHGTTVERELLLYTLHGLLHLCGYDDRTAAAYKAMHRKEDQILTRIGVGPVFSRTSARSKATTPRGRR